MAEINKAIDGDGIAEMATKTQTKEIAGARDYYRQEKICSKHRYNGFCNSIRHPEIEIFASSRFLFHLIICFKR